MTTETPDVSKPILLEPKEYERRRDFLNSLKGLTKSEFIEIVKLLKKYNVAVSENANGVFFNVALVDQVTFDALELFLRFAQTNRRDLASRETYLSTLTLTSPDKVTLE